jgi:hypothetical protein
MSSKSEGKNYEKVAIKEIETEERIDFSKIVIPFSKIGRMKNPSYIYYGFEKIPFNKRHPLFQTVLRNEFTDTI